MNAAISQVLLSNIRFSTVKTNINLPREKENRKRSSVKIFTETEKKSFNSIRAKGKNGKKLRIYPSNYDERNFLSNRNFMQLEVANNLNGCSFFFDSH